jgi:glucose-1-phosphate adenylyltransferase
MAENKTLAIILAGGEGNRLKPLTLKRAKPAVPFGGSYRIIDFVLSNVRHSGISKVGVLTQYMPDSLRTHLERGWTSRFGRSNDSFLVERAPKTGNGFGPYTHTANAVYQNLNLISDNPLVQTVNVLGGDHIYFMDYSQMNEFHRDMKADATISAIRVPVALAAKNYGVCTVDETGKLLKFTEKPEFPDEIPNDPGFCLASMGNYTFNAKDLVTLLAQDNADETSKHDFGGNIIPKMLSEGHALYVYNFSNNEIPGMTKDQQGRWRDVGNVEQLALANFELLGYEPQFNIYNEEWQILTHNPNAAAAKILKSHTGDQVMIGNGSIITECNLERTIVSGACYVDHAQITNSLLLGNNKIGRGTVLDRVIVDKDAYIPSGVILNPDSDEFMQFNNGKIISTHYEPIIEKRDGYIVVPKGFIWPKEMS